MKINMLSLTLTFSIEQRSKPYTEIKRGAYIRKIKDKIIDKLSQNHYY